LRALSRWERSAYLSSGIAQPDLVLKLIGSPAVLHERRPEMSQDVIVRKQEGILAVAFDPCTRVVCLDANACAQQVLASAMVAIGTILRGSPATHADANASEIDAAG